MTSRKLILFLTVALLALQFPLTAQAAPKTMPDGTVFDAAFYAETYPDVKAALGTGEQALYNHYKTFGIKEGRKPTAQAAGSDNFDAAFYAATYPDVVKALGTDPKVLLNHYKTFGIKEGRKPNANAAGTKTAAPQTVQQTQPAAPAPVANVNAPKTFAKRWRGRNASILGDSISTFGGSMPAGYVAHYPQYYLTDRGQMWWSQALGAGGMNLVANASWSGSQVCGDPNDESGKPGCSVNRAQALFGKDVAPNVIFIMMGTNDFLRSNAPSNFAGAYGAMLSNIRAKHPGAQIVCLTCLPVICTSTGTKQVNEAGFTIDDYNAQIRNVAASHGAAVCDTAACGITSENWGRYLADGIHPNAAGMTLVANYIVNHL